MMIDLPVTPRSTYLPMTFKGKRDIFNKRTERHKMDIFAQHPRSI